MTSIRTCLAGISFGAIGGIAVAGGSGAMGFEASNDTVGPDRTKFVLSQDYPTDLAAAAEGETSPWRAFDFKTETGARGYLFEVLRYVVEGNEDIFAPGPDALDRPWLVQVDGKTRWYHVPWMHHGVFGREGLHGLTRERSPRLSELLEEPPAQDKKFQAWAVSFYNPLGGYTIGKVWPDEGLPNPAAGSFPQGTVVAKLLFAEATEQDLAHLKGAPSWRALIHQTPEQCSVVPADNKVSCDRVEGTVQLLQLDVAVKDDRAEDTNWVFGTFVFNGKLRPDAAGALLPGSRMVERASAWNQLEPVGLMWGNELDETVLTEGGVPQHLGCNARLNGPVDNPAASCMACHALARFPAPEPDNFSMRFPPCGGVSRDQDGLPTAISAAYFRNLGGHEVIDDVTDVDVPEVDLLPKVQNLDRIRALDFSLQLSFGLINYCNFWAESDREPSRDIEIFCDRELPETVSPQAAAMPPPAAMPQADDAKAKWFSEMASQSR